MTTRNPRAWFLALTLAFVAMGGVGCGDETRPLQTLREGLDAHHAGRLQEAVEAYRAVLEQDPDNKFALYNLGLIAQTRRNPTEAEDFYRRVLGIDPAFVPALFNLAILRENAGSYQEAIELYRRVIAIAPDNAGAHLNLGYLLRKIGKKKEGDKEIARARELDPSQAPEESSESDTSQDGKGSDGERARQNRGG